MEKVMELFKIFVSIIFLIGWLSSLFWPKTKSGGFDQRFSFKTRLIFGLIGLVIMIVVTGLMLYFCN